MNRTAYDRTGPGGNMTREQGGNMTRGPGENPSGGIPQVELPPAVLLHHKQLVMSGKFRFFRF